MKRAISIITVMISLQFYAQSQYCDSLTPSFYADLSASPSVFWISPPSNRDGNCCGTTSPDNCIEFEILLHPDATSIVFDFYSGAVPPGALFYQVDCGPIVEVGSPICLDGLGPHHLTFCKPGNNSNEYSIQSIPIPEYGPDIILNEECIGLLGVSGMNESTIVWTSVFPGDTGAYDMYLNCTSGCDTVEVTSQEGYPDYVSYLVCGMPLNECDTLLACHTMTVDFNPYLDLSLLPELPVVCYGDTTVEITANYSGGTPPYTFEWSNLSTDTSIVVGTGTYWLRLSDSSDCPASYDTVTVVQQTVPIAANSGQDISVCETDIPVQLNGTVTGASGGVWTGGGGIFDPNNTDLNALYNPTNAELLQGYTELFLTSIGNLNCSAATDTVTIIYRNITKDIDLLIKDNSCNNSNDGSASLIIVGSGAPYSLAWSNGDTANAISNLTVGNYFVVISNTYGCDTMINFSIAEPQSLQYTNTFQNVSCNGQNNGQVDITGTGGTEPYSLDWNNSGSLIAFSGDSISVSGLVAGTYSFIIYDSLNCKDSASVTIAQPMDLQLDLVGSDTVCFGGTQYLDAQITEGTMPYVYSWSNSNINTPLNWFTPLSSGYVSVIVFDQNNCSVEDSIYTYLQQLYSDSLDVFVSGDICSGEEAVISSTYAGSTSNLEFFWMPIMTTGPGPFIVQPLENETYILTVTDYCNNQIVDSVNIVVYPTPVISLPYNISTGCAPLEVDFPLDSSHIGSELIWSYGENGLEGTNMTYVYHFPGTYLITLNVTNQYGCGATSTGIHQVVVRESPIAGILVDKTTVDMYFPFINFKSNSLGAISYYWDFDDGDTAVTANVRHEYAQIGTYYVMHAVSNTYGCTDTAIQIINVKPTANVYIPNAFTPDGDGINDVFFIQGDGLVSEGFLMNIFDRWGHLVFTTEQLDGTWNGEMSNSEEGVVSGVYVYSITVTDIFNETHQITGHVSLVK